MSDTYSIKIHDAFGVPLLIPGDWVSVEGSRIENNVGACVITLPGYYSKQLFKRDGLITIDRESDSNKANLLMETCYRIRKVTKVISSNDDGTERLWRLHCKDLNVALERRWIDYNAGNAYTSKLDNGDDMMKAIVRENYGSLATDTIRSWATTLSVQSDIAAGQTLRKSFSRRPVIDVLQEIAETSLQLGTYLTFDIIPVVLPGAGSAFQAEFRTYAGWRGTDHRFPNGNPPVLIGPDFGNLENVVDDTDYDEEATRVIVGGQGEEELRAVARADDTARINESPWGLIEHFEDARDEGDSNYLLDEARAILKRLQPKRIVSGTIRPTNTMLFGIHYDFGDYVTAQVDGDSFDGHLSAVTFKKNRDEGEQIGVVVVSET